MRILVRTSRWAIWARRLGSFALPVALIPIVMHRERMIETPTFHAIELIAIAIAAASLLLAVGAFIRLWITGDQGWSKAALGMIFALVVLLPVGFGAVAALRYPRTTDITTDPSEPPALASEQSAAFQTPDVVAQVRAAFPNALGRSYPLEPAQVFAVANALARSRGWDIRVVREPQTADDEGEIHAIAMTLLGWRDEVSIRIRPDAQGSHVDMRSAALSNIPDLGANGQRVEEFLVALDAEITALLRDTPAAAAPDAAPAG